MIDGLCQLHWSFRQDRLVQKQLIDLLEILAGIHSGKTLQCALVVNGNSIEVVNQSEPFKQAAFG